MAGKFFRESLEIPKEPKELHMNEHFNRPDAAKKVNGTGKYADDLEFPDMLYAKAVRSPSSWIKGASPRKASWGVVTGFNSV